MMKKTDFALFEEQLESLETARSEREKFQDENASIIRKFEKLQKQEADAEAKLKLKLKAEIVSDKFEDGEKTFEFEYESITVKATNRESISYDVLSASDVLGDKFFEAASLNSKKLENISSKEELKKILKTYSHTVAFSIK
ncbi:MAG: hypothetical protein GY870_11275 [archaeon]|nr:hypothetical protein [archaeon]